MEQVYLCIDLKSFYASVECVERGLDPMTARLVVADPRRTEKTICLAVSPALRALGVRNRCRVFEIPSHIDYITAAPRMKLYIKYAADIYSLYLSYFSKEDIHVYSIDECFIDITRYLRTYRQTPRGMACRLMEQIRENIGVRATCGIGSNLYLAKVALDILAKHADDFIAELNEETYRQRLWDHRPLTDFWRIGEGTARRLAGIGVHTMRQLAAADEEVLYRLFGVDAELMIDHAKGRECVRMADIHAYKPRNRCLSSAQVLSRDYSVTEGRLIVREMADLLALDLVGQDAVAAGASLSIGYGKGTVGGPLQGGVRFERPTSSDRRITKALVGLYDRLVKEPATVRRLNVTLTDVFSAKALPAEQIDLFDQTDKVGADARDTARQRSMLTIKRRFGKNAIIKGMDLEDAATTRERNKQIGGHSAGE